MKKDKFDFEFEGKLNNTFSVFEQILFNSKDESKVLIALDDIQNIIPHAKAGLINVYDIHVNHREEIFNRLEFHIKEINRLIEEKNITFKDERLSILNIFSNILKEIFKKPIQETPKLKLKINAPKNVIFNLIQQLKTININTNQYLLSQDYNQLAEFFINYVEGFENNNIKNLSGEMAKKSHINKDKIQLDKIDETITVKKVP